MTDENQGFGEEKDNKEQHVDKLTDQELDKVSGGKVCLLCSPGPGPGPSPKSKDESRIRVV